MPTVSNLVSEVFRHRIETAVEAALSSRSPIQVFSHHDADGLSAAAVMCKALERAGLDFQLTIISGFPKKFAESLLEDKDYIIMDMGSSHLLDLEKKRKVVVLDHHQLTGDSERVFHVNPNLFDVDGTSEACASTLSFLFALALDNRNWDLAPTACIGMVGDKQHFGGFKGVNKLIVEAAVKKQLLDLKWSLSIFGKKLDEAITGSFDPYFVGLSGKPKETRDFLEESGFKPDMAMSDVPEEEMRRLASLLALRMLRMGLDPVGIDAIAGEHYTHKALNKRLEVLVEYANASGKDSHPGTCVAMLMGADWAVDDVEKTYMEYGKGLLEKLAMFEKSGAEVLGSIQYIESTSPGMSGGLAGIGMQFIFPQDKPTFAFAEVDGKLKFSCRGTRELVDNGLDLSIVCRKAGEKFGGEGGGHPVASGATVPLGSKKEFLEECSRLVSEQLGTP
ncbi:MAG: DHH family phosphoesterase [Candidatus Thermoplasmatota archaeon]|nr:DHH family phosphoesterase [Candidatus Thermoplasmatota archaeon]